MPAMAWSAISFVFGRLARFLREGSNEDASQVVKDLTGWGAVVFAISVVLGLGSIGMTSSPPDYAAAKFWFTVAAIIFLVKVCDYLATKKIARRWRMILAFVIFGGVGIGITEYWHYINARKALYESINRPRKEVIVELQDSAKTTDTISTSPSPTPIHLTLTPTPTPPRSFPPAPSPAPQPAPAVVIQAPSAGNLKERANQLADEMILDLTRHGWYLRPGDPVPLGVSPMPLDQRVGFSSFGWRYSAIIKAYRNAER